MEQKPTNKASNLAKTGLFRPMDLQIVNVDSMVKATSVVKALSLASPSEV